MLDLFVAVFVGFMAGLVIGFPLGLLFGGRKLDINLRTFAGVGVLVCLFTAIGISFINPEFEVSLYLYGMGGGIVTALFGEEVFKK
jgi:hypothetical protein